MIKDILNNFLNISWNPNKDFDYLENVENAFAFTEKLGLEVPNFNFDRNLVISNEEKQILINSIVDKIYNIDELNIEDVALKCYLMSKEIQSFLYDKFSINSLITNGYTYIRLNKVYRKFNFESKKSINKRLTDKNFNEPIKFHTWLTLINYDIIDVTFLPTFWAITDNSCFSSYEEVKKILWSSPSQNYSGISYKPIFVGYDYFNKVNINPKIHFKIL